ncbi:MAG: hypothetical protein COZ06_18445 [Armatimonadetes bacterium CG_4_10_14_3_um_filter_66_18]|nr:hypothetical protein [Armatimonadota bacterium]OIP05355.1 MAG: hypothetical protein AUJ96_11015 [Armatimonadetes bacterium CG2_30_66_41]PIU94142.1 MAG: hypothetical protein COS65_09180 [Armatimonadetes bacterium CG06_land_8_20_14_3_00_66_21]PIX45447.1 MAG: hypothetical protein COZ57_15335 [Armatimonadetes bacterium CG_4_8_14_3_um_filter_66_20]PIY46529.1 MAG: hypothetical protein COZ06_18445 [Armatimonadetes bacterium CG_4_10_14_3_um_filter_66_18]PJB73697.1 MAG: hypothetical protein CO096_05
MRPLLLVSFLFCSLAGSTTVQAASAATLTVEGLSLTVDARARVTGLSLGGTDVLGGAAASALVSLCDVTKGEAFVAGTPTGGDLPAGLAVDFADAQASAKVRCVAAREALHFTCDLQGARDLPARGVLLRFAFPADCLGWRWHDDIQTSRPIAANEVYENVRGLRAWADLPEWADKPALRIGYANRNFCTVLTGAAGLCLSVPLDRPCIFRTAYDAKAKQLQLVFDLALSPDTQQPNAWSFAFDVYPGDPKWGFRSALARYYALYPDLFRNYVPKPGQWLAFNRLSQIDNANEFLFGLQEGAPEPEYDDKIGVQSCTYFTHAGMFANLPNYDPEKDALPPYEAQVEAVEAQFKRTTGMDGLYHQVGLQNAAGKLDVQKTSVYGHVIAQFNLDPDLPYGAWHLKRTAEQTKSLKDRAGGDLDGFYYDGLTAGLNYRTDHFRTSAAPPLWDPVAKKPLLNNFFSACQFARAAAELLRPRGQITMMNGALGASFYVAPWLDVSGAETGLRINREELNYLRSVAYHKPFLTLLKGNYEQEIGHAEMELFMKRALAYGIFPGFFDWPPSGLGPGGQYWNHPEYYERDRDLFRTYEPLCQTLALAGWEPLTYARSSSEHVFVERFGPGNDGVVWLTLLNEDKEPHTTTKVTVDVKGLALDATALRCVEILSGKSVALSETGNALSADLEVAADDVALLQLCTPQQAAGRRLAWAQEALERGIKMQGVEAGKPALAVHWRAQKAYYGREQLAAATAVVFEGDGRGVQDCTQWAMLFQPEAAPVTLTVRAAGENLAGDGKVQVLCNAAWVSPSFTHYERQSFDLPKGTYAAKDLTFMIECKQPLRAIALTPQMDGNVTGKLKLTSIRLADRFAADYLVDPEFAEWYEPVPAQRRSRLTDECGALREALATAQAAVIRGLTTAPTRAALIDLGARCASLRKWIADAKAENGCRRTLRELATVEQQVGIALLASLGTAAPEIKGPTRAAPGDEVGLSFALPSVTEVPVQGALAPPEGVSLKRTAAGGVLSVPDTATPGQRLVVAGTVLIGPAGKAASVHASHTVEIVPPLELTLTTGGADPDTGAVHVRAEVMNNRTRAADARVVLTAPGGWKTQPAKALPIPAGKRVATDLTVAPAAKTAAGLVELAATVSAGKDAARASKLVLHIPKEANLLRNAGFEEGAAGWSGLAGSIAVDKEVHHSGTASARGVNANSSAQSTLSQSVTLNQQQPCAILVRAASRGEQVSGGRDKGYSLYVDLYYTDGTPLYGQTFDFETGTTDWQLGELCIEPTKPIRNVNLYLLLRGKSGTAWFDDVAVMEDPRRQGNLAREAEITVDSRYTGYRTGPLNDGLLYPRADAHWTDESWASADAPGQHFVQLTFPRPTTLARATVYWSMDAGTPHTSAEVQLQVKDGDSWRTLATAPPAEPSPFTVLSPKAPATANVFRFLQPAGKGSAVRPNLMWVREVEVFAPE